MINLKNSALVVIDMQKGFLNDQSRHIIPNVVSLIHEFTTHAMPVVFTKFINSSNSPFELLINWKKHYSSPDTDFAIELERFDRIEITKNFYTALTSAMMELISANDWRTVVLCGVATESCVLKTAVDAFELGLLPIVISDACASDRGEELHNAGLSVLQRFIGAKQIVSTDDVFDAISW